MFARALIVPSVFLVMPFVAACGSTSSGQSRSQGRGGGQPVQIATTQPTRISVQRLVDISGTLTSPDQARVSSEAAGVVREVTVELGSEVRAGDVLVRIEPREHALALERAESALRQVEAQLGIDRPQDKRPPPDEQIASVRQALANRDDARAARARAEQLNGRGLLSQVDRETAETRLKVADANYQAAIDNVRALKASLQDRRASYDLAQKKVNDAVIRAPVAGSVAERAVQTGEYIRENTPVVTIVQMHPLKLKTAVQEKFAALIKPGQTVHFRVEAFPDRTFEGQVAYVSPAVDQATRTFPIEAMVANQNRVLKPGFFAQGTIATRLDENVLAVPEDAVSTLAGVSTVYVIEGDKARQQIVTLGVRQRDVWEITDGLNGSELLASSNLSQLATGTKVAAAKGDAGSARRGEK